MKKLTPGQSILQGLKEALAYTRGEKTGCKVHKVKPTKGKRK